MNAVGVTELSDDGKTLTVRAKFDMARLISVAADDTLEAAVRGEMVRIISEDAALQATIRKLALAQLLKLAEQTA